MRRVGGHLGEVSLIQCSPYQAVSGKIYRRNNTSYRLEPLEGLLTLNNLC